MAEKPWLLWVWVRLHAPRPDGLSDGAEAPTLWEIEDALVPALAAAHGAVLAGCITTQNRREFYFYGEQVEGIYGAMAMENVGYRQYALTQTRSPGPQ